MFTKHVLTQVAKVAAGAAALVGVGYLVYKYSDEETLAEAADTVSKVLTDTAENVSEIIK